MIIQNTSLVTSKIVSIQTGRSLGKVNEVLVDPRDLSVPALFVNERNSKSDSSVLHTEDIREYSHGIIVADDYESIMDYLELPKLLEVVDFDFGIVNSKVITESGKKLGKASSFSINTKGSWQVAKIHVEQSLLRNISITELIIDRSQVTKTGPDKIYVKDSHADAGHVKRGRQHKLSASKA